MQCTALSVAACGITALSASDIAKRLAEGWKMIRAERSSFKPVARVHQRPIENGTCRPPKVPRLARVRNQVYGPTFSHASVKLSSSVNKPDGCDITVVPSLATIVISTRLAPKAAEPTGPLAPPTVASQVAEMWV